MVEIALANTFLKIRILTAFFLLPALGVIWPRTQQLLEDTTGEYYTFETAHF